MLNIPALTRDLMAEEDDLEAQLGDAETAEVAIVACLLAIHKRQRDAIILGLRS